MDNAINIDSIRRQIPVLAEYAYFNTGASGPLPQPTLDRLHASLADQARLGRGNFYNYEDYATTLNAVRGHFGRLGNVAAETIALTHNTTEGINLVVQGLNWQPDDELVITNCEHPGGYMPAFYVQRRYGVNLRMVNIDLDDSASDALARIEAAITSRTKLVLLSHILWNSGLRLSLRAIVTEAHHNGAMVLIDGAQSAGSIALDFAAAGVDFYAMPAQKWLLGPEGIGALYVRPDRMARIQPTIGGYTSLVSGESYDLSGQYLLKPTAARYEYATVFKPALNAMQTTFEWLENEVGWQAIYDRTQQLAVYAYDSLSAVEGVELITRADAGSGLITFTLPGYDPARVMLALIHDNVIVRFLSQPYALRASIAFFNNEQDIDRLATCLRSVLQQAPNSLPIYTPHS